MDILYTDCLEKMGLKDAQLSPSSQPLYGLMGHCVQPVTAGEHPNTATVMADFVVIKGGGAVQCCNRPAYFKGFKSRHFNIPSNGKVPDTQRSGMHEKQPV